MAGNIFRPAPVRPLVPPRRSTQGILYDERNQPIFHRQDIPAPQGLIGLQDVDATIPPRVGTPEQGATVQPVDVRAELGDIISNWSGRTERAIGAGVDAGESVRSTASEISSIIDRHFPAIERTYEGVTSTGMGLAEDFGNEVARPLARGAATAIGETVRSTYNVIDPSAAREFQGDLENALEDISGGRRNEALETIGEFSGLNLGGMPGLAAQLSTALASSGRDIVEAWRNSSNPNYQGPSVGDAAYNVFLNAATLAAGAVAGPKLARYLAGRMETRLGQWAAQKAAHIGTFETVDIGGGLAAGREPSLERAAGVALFAGRTPYDPNMTAEARTQRLGQEAARTGREFTSTQESEVMRHFETAPAAATQGLGLGYRDAVVDIVNEAATGMDRSSRDRRSVARQVAREINSGILTQDPAAVRARASELLREIGPSKDIRGMERGSIDIGGPEDIPSVMPPMGEPSIPEGSVEGQQARRMREYAGQPGSTVDAVIQKYLTDNPYTVERRGRDIYYPEAQRIVSDIGAVESARRLVEDPYTFRRLPLDTQTAIHDILSSHPEVKADADLRHRLLDIQLPHSTEVARGLESQKIIDPMSVRGALDLARRTVEQNEMSGSPRNIKSTASIEREARSARDAVDRAQAESADAVARSLETLTGRTPSETTQDAARIAELTSIIDKHIQQRASREAREMSRKMTAEQLDGRYQELLNKFKSRASANPMLDPAIYEMVVNRIAKGVVSATSAIDSVFSDLKDHLTGMDEASFRRAILEKMDASRKPGEPLLRDVLKDYPNFTWSETNGTVRGKVVARGNLGRERPATEQLVDMDIVRQPLRETAEWKTVEERSVKSIVDALFRPKSVSEPDAITALGKSIRGDIELALLSDRKVDQIISGVLRASGDTIYRTAREGYSNLPNTAKNVADAAVASMGLEGSMANRVRNAVEKRFTDRVNDRLQKEMPRIEAEARKIHDRLMAERAKARDLRRTTEVDGPPSSTQKLVDRIEGSARGTVAQRIRAKMGAHGTVERKADSILVSTLNSIARKVMPKSSRTNNAIETVVDAIRRPAEYRRVWAEAQAELQERYKNNPRMLEALKPFFDRGLETPFYPDSLNTVIRGAIRSGGINLPELVRQHFRAAQQAGKTLAEKIVEQTGLDPENAALLANEIQSRFESLVTERKRSALIRQASRWADRESGWVGETRSRNWLDNFIDLSNKGALSDEAFRAFAERNLGFKPRALDAATRARLVELADRFQEEQDPRVKRQIERQILNEQANLVEASSAEKWLEVLNTMRAATTTWDLSAPGQQGAWFLLSHPVQSAKAFGKMLRAFASEEAALAVDDDIHASPLRKIRDDAGLYVAPIGVSPNIAGREEQFNTNIIRRIPGVRASERAYTTYLNSVRASLFDNLVQSNINRGTEFSRVELEQLADYINNGTGRGTIPKSFDFQALHQVLFSPKRLASVFQTPLVATRLNTRVGRIAARDLAMNVAAGTALLGMAKMMGADVETDPRSTDFAKIKVGNTRYNIMGPWHSLSVLASRIASGQVKTTDGRIKDLSWGNLYGPSYASLVGRFGRSKLSPQSGLLVDAMLGTDYAGNDIDFGSLVGERAVPMTVQDFYDAVQEHGTLGVLMATPSTFGVGTQTYQPRQRKNSRPSDRIFTPTAPAR